MKIKGKKFVSCIGLLSLALNTYAQDAGVKGHINLTLDKAIEIALAENPTIKVADKDIRLKEIADKEAWQNLLPTVDAGFALSHSIKVAAIKTQMGEFKMGQDGSTTATGSLTLNLPLFAPAVYQNMKLTKEDIQLAQEKARSSRLDLVNQVTKAYYAALLSQDSYKVMEKSYKTAKDNADLIKARFEVGSVSEYDKISADVQARSMNSNLVNAKTGVTLSMLQLKVLMGVTADVDITIADSLKRYENSLTLPGTSADEESLSDNSTLRQLDMNMAILQRSRKILNTNFMPTLALQLQGQYLSYSNQDWNFINYKYSPAATLAISLSVPIFHASSWTKLKSNKLQIEQLEDTRLNTKRQLSLAIESYKQNMASTIAQVESNREAVLQADKAVKISSKRYEIGGGTVYELNQSETAYTQTELTYAQSIYNYLTSRADLEYTLGRETYIK